MSRTIARLPYQRFVRRATSGQVTNTQWLGALAGVRDDLMAAAPWQESAEAKALLPVNVPTTPDFGGDAYDAYKQSGAAEPGTGTQAIFAGMAAYRIPIPSGAMTGHVARVEFSASADKFCVGGLKVSVVLSDSATPPDDWAMIRQGGYGDTPDETGDFATVGTVDDHDVEVLGILAETSATVAAARNQAGHFAIDLPDNDTAYEYVYVIVSLYDYGAWRREYWAEGSGAIDGASITLMFEGDVDIPESTDYDIRLPLRAIGNVQHVRFTKSGGNLEDDHLRMLWGVRMLQGGLADASDTSPAVSDSGSDVIAPLVQVQGGNTVARGCYSECYCPAVELAGRKLWVRCVGNVIGASPVRVSVIDSASAPDVTDAATWNGTSADCIGSAIATRLQDGDAVSVLIRRNARTSSLWIVAAVTDIAIDDMDKLAVGYAAGDGVSLRDAHISRLNFIPQREPPREGIVSFSSDAAKPGMMFGGAQSVGSGADSFAISEDGSATAYGTSYGGWKRLGDDALPAFITTIRAGARYVLGLGNGGRLFYAGDTSALDNSIDWTAATGIDFAIVKNGVVVMKSNGTCTAYGTAAAINHGADVGAWTNVWAVRSNGNIVAGLCNDLTLKISGLDTPGTSTLEGLTDVVDARMSSNRIIVMFADQTVQAWSIAGNVITPVAVSWSGITAITASNRAVWGVSASGVEVVAGTPIHGNFYKPEAIPENRKPVMLVGSNHRRLAVGYTEA
jgi:hypothetical protein